jgi:hypothetical protein
VARARGRERNSVERNVLFRIFTRARPWVAPGSWILNPLHDCIVLRAIYWPSPSLHQVRFLIGSGCEIA